jgi:hypothetical protein
LNIAVSFSYINGKKFDYTINNNILIKLHAFSIFSLKINYIYLLAYTIIFLIAFISSSSFFLIYPTFTALDFAYSTYLFNIALYIVKYPSYLRIFKFILSDNSLSNELNIKCSYLLKTNILPLSSR